MNFAHGLVIVATASLPLSLWAGPIENVRAKFEAFNRHDSDFIENSYAADARLQSPDYPDLSGNKPIADTYRGLFAAIPDAHDEIQSLEAGPDHVYAQFLLTGHLQGDPAKPVHVRIISVYQLRGDLIVEDVTYYDRKY